MTPAVLAAERPESKALLAIRDACRDFEEDPTLGVLFERLQGQPSLEIILRAHKYAEDIRFSAEEAETEFGEALVKAGIWHGARRSWTEMRGRGLASKEELRAFQEKNLAYKRLQGALPSP